MKLHDTKLSDFENLFRCDKNDDSMVLVESKGESIDRKPLLIAFITRLLQSEWE